MPGQTGAALFTTQIDLSHQLNCRGPNSHRRPYE